MDDQGILGVPASRVASDVREHQPFAGGQECLEEHVLVPFPRRHVSFFGRPARPQVERVQRFGGGEHALVETGHEDHPERQRPHGDERRDGHPFGRPMTAAFAGPQARPHKLGRHQEAGRQLGRNSFRHTFQGREAVSERAFFLGRGGPDDRRKGASNEVEPNRNGRGAAARGAGEGQELAGQNAERLRRRFGACRGFGG